MTRIVRRLALLLAVPLLVLADEPAPKGKAGAVTLSKLLAEVEFGDPEKEKALLERTREPAALDEATARLRQWLTAPALSDAEERRLRAVVQLLGEEPKVEALLAGVLGDRGTPPATLRLALRVLGQWGSRPPQAWLDGIAAALNHRRPEVRAEAVYAIKTLELRSFDERLRDLMHSADEPDDLRVTALACLAPRQATLAADAFTLLLGHLSDRQPMIRLTAARALGASRLSKAQLLELAKALPGLSATGGALAVAAFSRSADVEAGQALIAALQPAAAGQLLSADELERLFVSYPAEVRSAAEPLFTRLAALRKRQADLLAKVEAEVPAGDPHRGREVFFAERAIACATCHRAQNRGGTLGPNLSRIGRIRSARELLRSILHPSAYIAPFFRPYVATLSDGRVVTGILVQESAEAIYLRSGTNVITRVPRQRLDDVTLARPSLMPDGFDRLLSRGELGDLLAFLAVLR